MKYDARQSSATDGNINDVVDQDSVEQAWVSEITSRVEDLLTGQVQTTPGDEVFAHIAQRRAARQAAPRE